MVDGGEDAFVRSQERLVFELEVLGERHEDLLGDRARRSSRPRLRLLSTVMVGRVAGSIWCGTSSRVSRDVRPDDLAGGCARDHDAGAEDEDHRDGQGDPSGPSGRSRVRRCRRPRAGSRSRGGRRPPSAARENSRSRIGRAAQRATSPARSRPWCRTRRSGAPSGACSRGPRARRTRRDRPARAGTVFGSVIMKNRKIRTSGEVTITRQKSKPQTGAKAQRATMQWPDAGEQPEAGRRARARSGRQAPAGAAAA